MPENTYTYNPGAILMPAMTDTGRTIAVALGASLTLNAGIVLAQDTGDGKFYKYDPTVIADPTALPVASGTGAGGTFGAGSYSVQYTLETANGQTLASPADSVVLTASQSLQIAALAGLAATVTRVNFFVNRIFVGFVAPSSGSTAIQTYADFPTGTPARAIPVESAAFTAVTGRHIPRVILAQPVVTNASGRVTFGDQASNELNSTSLTVPAYWCGVFRRGDLLPAGQNFDARAISMLGHMLSVGPNATSDEDLFVFEGA